MWCFDTRLTQPVQCFRYLPNVGRQLFLMQWTLFLEILVIIPLVLLSYFLGKFFIILRSIVGHIIPCWDYCLSNEPFFIGQEMIEGTRNIWPLNLVFVVLQGWQAWFSVTEWQNLWPIRLFCSVDSRFFLSESFYDLLLHELEVFDP